MRTSPLRLPGSYARRAGTQGAGADDAAKFKEVMGFLLQRGGTAGEQVANDISQLIIGFLLLDNIPSNIMFNLNANKRNSRVSVWDRTARII